MLKPGLVSITFRKLSPEAVIAAAVDAGLQGIEWGGDVHVPHGDAAAAERVAKLTADAGLAVSAYGSYYRLGGGDGPPFDAVLDSAAALGAPYVRVWAGGKGSGEADGADWQRIVAGAHDAADAASRIGVGVTLEWHAKTLTDSADAGARLLREADHPNLYCFWQPRNNRAVDFNLDDMDAALPHLAGLHVFHWSGPSNTRHPLADGEAAWTRYLAKAAPALVGRDAFASLEFVQGDDPANLPRDAATLRRLLAAAPGG